MPAKSPSEIKSLLAERIHRVRERIAAACRRVGRAPEDVILIAVTKTISPEVAGLLPDLGVFDLGESRPQELWKKAAALPESTRSRHTSEVLETSEVSDAALPEPVRWHLIGHLQRNKIETTLPLVSTIHSVDSERLLQALEEVAAQQQRRVPVLLEVNASREANKQGFAPEVLPGLIPAITKLHYLQIQGLMTMAAFESEPDKSRPTFVTLRQLRDELSRRAGIDPGAPGSHPLHHLSMGMSNDFEIGIEEGATMVRIGTTLFEGLSERDP